MRDVVQAQRRAQLLGDFPRIRPGELRLHQSGVALEIAMANIQAGPHVRGGWSRREQLANGAGNPRFKFLPGRVHAPSFRPKRRPCHSRFVTGSKMVPIPGGAAPMRELRQDIERTFVSLAGAPGQQSARADEAIVRQQTKQQKNSQQI